MTSVTAQSEYRGTDFTMDATVEGVDSPGGRDVTLKGSYMQSLTQAVAMGVQCRVGLLSGTTDAKLRGRYSRGACARACVRACVHGRASRRVRVRVCGCACVRACMRACVRACVRVCAQARAVLGGRGKGRRGGNDDNDGGVCLRACVRWPSGSPVRCSVAVSR